MQPIYFDNAATTPLDPQVLEAMLPYMKEHYGNPSSVHAFGRKTRAAIEVSRRTIAELLNCTPAEIFFTSGGTEADNMSIRCAVEDLGVEHIISSTIEHHAVTYSCELVEKSGKATVSRVKITDNGHIDMEDLERLLKSSNKKTLVSLMHANNELGNRLDLKKVGVMCHAHGAIFHSDTVQTMAHYKFDLENLPVDMINGAAHKFHGPKGVGFIYISNGLKMAPMILGGSQERNMRAGTENIYGIVGMAKAMEIAMAELEAHQEHVWGLKGYMIEKLQAEVPGIQFNGDIGADNLYTVLSVRLPETEHSEMLLYNLDIAGIACSGGSACSSGSNKGSHVMEGAYPGVTAPSVRFSFSKFNKKEEVDRCVEVLKSLYAPVPA